MILYAITSRVLLGENEADRSKGLMSFASEWAANGVDYIQLREKDLSSSHLLRLASSLVSVVRAAKTHSQVLINGNASSATAIALAAGADGVHLPGQLDSQQVVSDLAAIRAAWTKNRGSHLTPVISISCHSPAEVRAARSAEATMALFAPVFEKPLPGARNIPGAGLDRLSEACRAARDPGSGAELPVLALGGVTISNAPASIAAGAAGIAGIRLFLSEKGSSGFAWKLLSADRS